MEEYPIIFNETRIGTLTVTKEGLLTVFNAHARDMGELLRLSVYGGGREGYLGVMRPEDGKLRLIKRLSKSAMAEFPQEFEYAAPSGGYTGPYSEPLQEPITKPVIDTDILPEEGDTLWFSAADGTLSTFDGRRMLIALPADGVNLPKGTEGVRRIINGGEYIVFSR